MFQQAEKYETMIGLEVHTQRLTKDLKKNPDPANFRNTSMHPCKFFLQGILEFYQNSI
jgi:hypothetical protein